MPAATNKSDLLSVTRREYAKLIQVLDQLDVRMVDRPHPDDGICVQEVVGHRAHWIGLFLGWYQDGVDGKPVETPAPGYKWNQLKAYNADVYAAARSGPWKDVRGELEQKHEALLSLIESLTEDRLYTPHLYDWMNDWTIGRWAEASGASHYRSAAKYIRQIQKRVTADT